MDIEPGWPDLATAAAELGSLLLSRGWMLGCAESCTGGLVGAAITSVAGSSAWFERGFVTYSNRAKHELLGVPETLLVNHGAVSREVALAMARGVLARAPVQAALAITGIAGPDGGSALKPVGLVWCAWAWRDARGEHSAAASRVWPGPRDAVRVAAAAHALRGLLQQLAPAELRPAAEPCP